LRPHITDDFALRFALLDQVTQWSQLAWMALGMFVTIVSGFLVMTWFVGARLSRSQATVVIAIYLAFAGFTIWATFFTLAVAETFDPQNFGLPRLSNNNGALPVHSAVQWHHMGAVIQLAIVAASLWFFRDVRRSLPQRGRDGSPE